MEKWNNYYILTKLSVPSHLNYRNHEKTSWRPGLYRLHEHEFHQAMPLGIMKCVYCGMRKATYQRLHYTKMHSALRWSVRRQKRSIFKP